MNSPSDGPISVWNNVLSSNETPSHSFSTSYSRSLIIIITAIFLCSTIQNLVNPSTNASNPFFIVSQINLVFVVFLIILYEEIDLFGQVILPCIYWSRSKECRGYWIVLPEFSFDWNSRRSELVVVAKEEGGKKMISLIIPILFQSRKSNGLILYEMKSSMSFPSFLLFILHLLCSLNFSRLTKNRRRPLSPPPPKVICSS